jgi:hypothetical protein
LSVVKYALLAAAITCCGTHPTHAMMSGDALSSLNLAFAEPVPRELVRWRNERPAVSCNLRIPCPFFGPSGQRRHLHLSYRGSDREISTFREAYRPCPASVAFPNGRLACLGLP